MTNDIIEEATGARTPISTTDQDEKNMGLITWILTLFFGFIPGLIIYFVKTDSAYIRDQSKEALNWSITAIFAYIVALILTVIVIGVFLIPVIGICHLVFCIMGAVSTSKGNGFRVPFAIRLIK
ncbi:DUF4870 domain-containing protein [Marinimicrobium alkaliphilum]|uniref:DUF4870 domain-containing protein n=1 Tax=Marinimicrobium alkaliphilum TaxID=2202654 RepID=UPI000DBA1086|nr:DUF4870 domain-containing protein [Marinimicrobium alkaliphilum]